MRTGTTESCHYIHTIGVTCSQSAGSKDGKERSVAFTTLSSVCMNLRMSTVSCFSLGEAQSEADSKPQSLSSVRYKSCRDVFVVWSLVETSQMEAELMSYIRKNMLGGAMIWAIDLDDFHGLYGEKWPLLSVVKNALLVETKPEQLPGPVLNPPVPVVIPPVAGSPVSVEKGVMNCTGQGFVRDSNDCAVYYRCEWAMKHTYICPEGLFYDSQLTLCNWPELTDCPLQAAIMEQTTLVPPVMVSTAGSVAVLCQSNGMFEDSYDCRGYYVCQDGQPQRYTCSLGQSFNPSTGLCHYGTSPRCATQVKTRQYYEDEFIGGLPCSIICLRGLTLRRAASTCSVVSEEDYKVMCYFTNWAWYRKGEGKFVPEHLDSRLCTHIVYAYASLDPNDLVIKPFDPWADIDNNFYQRITGTGRPGAGAVNVLLALGGWTDSSGDKYSRLVSNGSARRKFVTSVVAYLRRHNFRGLQLDWTYPKCWQSNCGKGPSSDKPNFTKLVQAINTGRDFPVCIAALYLSLSNSMPPTPRGVCLQHDPASAPAHHAALVQSALPCQPALGYLEKKTSTGTGWREKLAPPCERPIPRNSRAQPPKSCLRHLLSPKSPSFSSLLLLNLPPQPLRPSCTELPSEDFEEVP
uniref:Chitinase n=1 Tax=Timema bartmani TaxID=61472 RepID=A0A7R9EPA6_9NEOP|nr:unnamed protein product [Timema bartmani]